MKRNRGFTIIEMLVVLAIIGILMAILFPALKSAKESGYQANCMSNLHQIGLAAAQYHNDEKAYPASLAFLLPAEAQISNNDTPQTTIANVDGTGWIKTTKILMCPDDDNNASVRSSYGDISIARPATPSTYTEPSDMSRYVWNYFGYDALGTAYLDDATAATAVAAMTPAQAAALLYNPALGYNLKTNPLKYSLSNRYAPANTIITHCIFHRTQTSNAADPTQIAANARDIVLRVDGAAKVIDISNFGTGGQWQNQKE